MKPGAAGLSGWLALVLLLPTEAGVPIPVPADLVMFTVGERVAAGAFPLWLAVAACPVCVGLGIISGRVPALAPLTVPEASPPGESDQAAQAG